MTVIKRCALPLLRSGSSAEERRKRGNRDNGLGAYTHRVERRQSDNAMMSQEKVKSKEEKE